MPSLPDNLAERSVLDALTRRSAATVTDLAEALAIPSSTAVGAVTRLLDKGLVFRRELAQSRRGRPSYQYGLRLPQPLAAFQLDGSQLAGAIFDQDQSALAIEMMHIPAVTSPAQAGGLLAELLGVMSAKAGVAVGGELLGAAVCINAIRSRSGTRTSSVLPWVDSTVQRSFAQSLGVPVQLVASPHLAAEYRLLEPPLPCSLAYLHVGDGVSSHFSVQGQPYQGATDHAGQLGHVAVDATGPLCGCGRRGCLEAWVSGPAVTRQLREAAKASGAPAWLERAAAHPSPRVALDHLWQAWQAQEPAAAMLVEPMLDRLGWGLGLLMNMVDPQRVIVGGYVLAHREAWVRQIADRGRAWMLRGGTRELTLDPAQASPEDHLRVIAAHFLNAPSLEDA